MGNSLRISRYQRKPAHVDAVKVNPENVMQVAQWSGGYYRHRNNAIYIPTLDGRLKAEPGDWIVKDENGNIVAYTNKQFLERFKKHEQ